MEIPKILKGKEVNLNHLGVSEVAWEFNDALTLLEHLENNKKFILGGDVLTKDSGKYQHNYDNWHFDTEQGNYKDSIQKTKEYIINYPKGEYAFIIVTN